jgi:hypothetical protein
MSKYATWYSKLIQKAVDRNWSKTSSGCYVERHHIVPKSLGGTNKKDNLVYLTAREHFIAHLLLSKMYCGKDRLKMLFALNMFTRNPSGNSDRSIKSRTYEYVRKEFSKAVSIIHSGLKKPKSENHKRKLSEARSKQVISAESYIKQAKVISSLVWMNNGIRSFRVMPSLVEKKLAEGLIFGRLMSYIDEKYKKNCSEIANRQWQVLKSTGHTGNLKRI